jgi:hypothetical protein
MEDEMNKLIIVAALSILAGCASLRNRDWEYVRIERELPSKSCVYKMQDSCSTKNANCFNDLKKRATAYDANTVLITEEKDQDGYNRSGFTGNAKGGNFTSLVVEYYYCAGVKNIKPKSK